MKKMFENIGKFAKEKPIAFIAGLAIIYFAVSFIRNKRKSKPTANDETTPNSAKEEAKETAQQFPASYSKSFYKTQADAIEEACMDVGTNEDAIYSVFSKMRNITDVLLLISAFGTRQKYEFGIPTGKRNLSGFLHNEMSSGEIENINSILRLKGINYAF